MGNTIMKKKEAVELHGSKDCKIHFAKYKKFTNKDLEKSLLKTINQIYESVEVIKQGNSYVYLLGAKREELAIREDGRATNGTWSIPYTKNMDIMVAAALESGSISEAAQTLSKWSLDFGLIPRKMYELLGARYHKNYREECLGELKKNNVIIEGEERILFDFMIEIKKIHKQLAGTLERMRKAGIIDYYLASKGFVEEGHLTVDLHEATVTKISTTERDLKEYYSVNDWYLSIHYNSPKSREYKKAWKERLSQITDENGKIIGLSFWYKTYAIVPTERKKKIIHYLEKYNQEVIEQFGKEEEVFLLKNKKIFMKRDSTVSMKKQKRRKKFFYLRKQELLNWMNRLKKSMMRLSEKRNIIIASINLTTILVTMIYTLMDYMQSE